MDDPIYIDIDGRSYRILWYEGHVICGIHEPGGEADVCGYFIHHVECRAMNDSDVQCPIMAALKEKGALDD